MISSIKILKWLIGGYIAIDLLFDYSSIVKDNSSLRILFVLVPILLLLWQALIIRARFQEPLKESASPFYERLETGDWLRVFGILWIGHTPLASHYVWGFYLFSGIVVVLLIVLTGTASVEFYRRRTAIPILIGCLAFAYFLLSWERNMYVVHYGVPIIGHFFEKPEYNAKYRVEIKPENSNVKYKAIADIHVVGRTETDEYGEEDWLGNQISHTYTYRDVWVKRLYFQNGGSVEIQEQLEPLHLGESVFVKDAHGISWYVKLLREPIL